MNAVYIAKQKIIQSTPRKLNLVARLVRGSKASCAANELRLCSKKAAKDILKVLLSAIANAENNFNADIDNLYISEVLVGKSMTLRRWCPRAKGRGVRILKRWSNIAIKLKEKKEEAI